MVVLDTDHITVLERQDQPGATALRARLAALPPADVVTTVISYEEHMQGWMAFLARTPSMAQQIGAYHRLLRQLENYRRMPMLTFDEAAAGIFQRLRRLRLGMGTMEVKIAAIALSHQALLLSKHLADFRQIPDLHVEDWTV